MSKYKSLKQTSTALHCHQSSDSVLFPPTFRYGHHFYHLMRHDRHHTVPDPCHLLCNQIQFPVLILVNNIIFRKALHQLQHPQEDIFQDILLSSDLYNHIQQSKPIIRDNGPLRIASCLSTPFPLTWISLSYIRLLRLPALPEDQSTLA